jgi:YVTN family beta-propeller protein
MVLNPDDHMIYTINLRDNSTSVIDSFTKRWIKDIYLGSTPQDIRVDPHVSGIFGLVFVALENNTIAVIDSFNQK